LDNTTGVRPEKQLLSSVVIPSSQPLVDCGFKAGHLTDIED
jgi:hypothetical protein